MKARVDCLPCILKQILATVRRVSPDAWFQARAAAMMMKKIAEFDPELSPAELTHDALRQLRSIIGTSDPFAEEWKSTFSIIEPGAQADPTARIHDSVVLRGGRVEAGATLVHSVVCVGGVVRRKQMVTDRVIVGGGKQRRRTRK